MDQAQESRFAEWWANIEPSLRRVVARMSGAGAIDTVQDVAVLALRNWNRFATYEDFARWCHIRAKWLALDELAQTRRHPSEPIESVEAQLAADDQPPLGDLLSLVEQLPERQRNVVIYKLMGYRTEEIARRMQIQASAVRSHWRFAQQALSRKVIQT